MNLDHTTRSSDGSVMVFSVKNFSDNAVFKSWKDTIIKMAFSN